jgi:hypothetical protein
MRTSRPTPLDSVSDGKGANETRSERGQILETAVAAWFNVLPAGSSGVIDRITYSRRRI